MTFRNPATGGHNAAAAALVHSFGGFDPQIDGDAFIAPGSIVIGDVRIDAGASVWFNCVLRGDVAPIQVGRRSNVQDGAVLHADPGFPVHIGEDVLIGHQALLHGCAVRDRGFVGMGAIVMNGAVVESDAILGAGAMLTEGKSVGSGQLWAGRPAKFLRDLSDDEILAMSAGPRHYQKAAREYHKLYAHMRAEDREGPFA